MNNNKFKYSSLSAAIVFALTACGGGSSNDSKSTQQVDKSPVAESTTLSDIKHWIPAHGELNVSDPDNDQLALSFFENGEQVTSEDNVYTFSHGLLKLNGIKRFTYTSLTGEPANIDYTVTANGKSADGQIRITNVISDPLANEQWHLRNTGQRAYALSDQMKQGLVDWQVRKFGVDEELAQNYFDKQFEQFRKSEVVAGEDLNVLEAYAQGVTGAGVTAVVVDSGLEIRHEDLIDNVLPNRSLNLIATATNKVDPTSEAVDGDHGTSVAGLIAAKGWNGLGGRGVAPDTSLIGMNILGNGQKVEQTALLTHGFPGSGITVDEPISVFNRSYGISYPAHTTHSELNEKIESYPVKVLRSGKGAINIKSSGNDFDSSGREGGFCSDMGTVDLGLTCYNGNSEGSQSNPSYFTVGAVNANGLHTSYSTAGANLIAASPAGEFGRFAPAMISTDPMTCLSGQSGYFGKTITNFTNIFDLEFAVSQFPFNYPGHPDNPSCNYISTMNGTSSAAPNMSGVVSLILSANPELTWRDVRHIIANTSTKVDAESTPIEVKIGDDSFIAFDGWVENAAGYSHNNLYGFGRLNAGEAVKMAKSYNANLGEEVVSEWVGGGTVMGQDPLLKEIPDYSLVGTEYKINVEDSVTIEAMQFRLDVFNQELGLGFETEHGNTQTTAGADLAVEVISPSGTRSVLLSSHQALITPAVDFNKGVYNLGYILKDGYFLSNAFYGEDAKGEWTIKLLDVSNKSFPSSDEGQNVGEFVYYQNNSAPSVLTGAAVRVFGHSAE
ncbi:S8 family serine peptidase [Pseudoalteromonas sp. T1lg65]|uniref:S8 family serine peptidase n=1 Tax=Pseudoalteromonas sp. T1lg65 TaxID=2077101 RepID=UPI003F78E039